MRRPIVSLESLLAHGPPPRRAAWASGFRTGLRSTSPIQACERAGPGLRSASARGAASANSRICSGLAGARTFSSRRRKSGAQNATARVVEALRRSVGSTDPPPISIVAGRRFRRRTRSTSSTGEDARDAPLAPASALEGRELCAPTMSSLFNSTSGHHRAPEDRRCTISGAGWHFHALRGRRRASDGRTT